MATEPKKWWAIHSNQFMTVNATSFDEFITMLEDNLEMFKEWQESGVVFAGIGVEDDCTHFYTTDPDLAADLDFEPEEEVFDDDI